jgi:hypothetical protein
MVTHIGGQHPQDALDEATLGETIVADPAVEHVLSAPLTVTTPGVTLAGCALRLADGADENLVEVGADDATLTNFRIDGNRGGQSADRHSNGVLVTGAQNVTLSGGVVRDTSRHGIRVVDMGTATSQVAGNQVHVPRGDPTADVTVQNVRVESPRRDGCSVEGPDVRNVSVSNVRTFDSSDRGGVEIKDGASDALVTGCYAENCRYGVAVQDHGEHSTSNVRFVGNTAVDCETLADAQTDHPPDGVVLLGNTGRRLGGDGMGGPGGVHMHLIHGLVAANNVLDGVGDAGLVFRRCRDATVTGNVVRDADGPGVAVEGCSGTGVRDNRLDAAGEYAVDCHGGDGATGIQVSDNDCGGGVRLAGDIDRYLVTTNLVDGELVDDADGSGLVTDNLR